MEKNKNNTLARVLAFVAVFCLLCALALVHEGRIFGYKPVRETAVKSSIITETADGMVINTTVPGKDITGYGGPVPLEIYVTDNKIDSIHALPNSETPGFFSRLEEGGLTSAWNGLSLKEASELKVDAVSGATYSSRGYIDNVRAGIAYALDSGAGAPKRSAATGVADIVAFVVLLCGAILPLFIRDRRYRLIQQLANVGVLGFWAGTFIDYAMMLNFFANGLTMTLASLTMLLLMVVGLLYPVFGKQQHYCNWICPFGSLQDLAGHLSPKKLHLSASLVKMLDTLRQALWVVLIALLFIGWGASWIDYEIFTAFIVKSASWIVMVVGAAFVILSIFIPRPFCRFVCPTGSLLKEL